MNSNKSTSLGKIMHDNKTRILEKQIESVKSYIIQKIESGEAEVKITAATGFRFIEIFDDRESQKKLYEWAFDNDLRIKFHTSSLPLITVTSRFGK